MKSIISKRNHFSTLRSFKQFITVILIAYFCLFTQLKLYSQYVQLDFKYLIPDDLISPILQFTDENNINYEVVWPNGISKVGITEMVQGDIWTTVLFHPTLKNTQHRKEIYANILYAVATMPAINNSKLFAIVELLQAIEVISPSFELAEKFGLIYRVLGEMNLKYVKGVDAWAKILNKFKNIDRQYIRAISFSKNFEMAMNALTLINAAMTISDIVTRTVIINALATEDAIRRLDILENRFQENPNQIPGDSVFMESFEIAKGRIKLDQQGWNAFARAVQENAYSVSQLAASTAIQSLAHKAAIMLSAKVGSLVSLSTIPIAVGIFDYFEMTGTMNSTKHALLAGSITEKIRNILRYYLANPNMIAQEDLKVLNESARYSQYEFYFQLKETFSGPLVDIAAFFWKDIADLREYYAEREKQALQILTLVQAKYSTALALVIDSTGSMSSNDPDNSRIYGGGIVLDQADSDWEIGIIDFDTVSKLVSSGRAREPALKDALRRVDSEGGTNIQAGLEEGYNYLTTASGKKKGAILLTDGEHNTPSSDFDYSSYVEIFAKKGWTVHTIGLTGSANEILLSKIADVTGGKYFKARKSQDMIYIFDFILSEFRLEGVLLIQEGKLKQDEIKDYSFYSDKTDKTLKASMIYPGSRLDFRLIDPSGKEFRQTDLSAGVEVIESEVYKIIKVEKPFPGEWKARVIGVEVEGTEEPFKIKISADTPIRIETKEVKPFYRIFEPIRFKANITGNIDKNSIKSHVKVTSPEGSLEEFPIKRDLNISYRKSGKPGVYYFDIKAEGKTIDGEKFMRETIQHVVVSSEGREFGVGEVVRSLGGYIEIDIGMEVGLNVGEKIAVFTEKEGLKVRIAEGYVISVSIGKSMIELTRVWKGTPQSGNRAEIERRAEKY